MLAPRTAWGLPMPSASHDSPGRAPRACAPCGAAPSRPSEPGGESTSRSTVTVPFSGVTEASAAPDPVSAASASPATPAAGPEAAADRYRWARASVGAVFLSVWYVVEADSEGAPSEVSITACTALRVPSTTNPLTIAKASPPLVARTFTPR